MVLCKQNHNFGWLALAINSFNQDVQSLPCQIHKDKARTLVSKYCSPRLVHRSDKEWKATAVSGVHLCVFSDVNLSTIFRFARAQTNLPTRITEKQALRGCGSGPVRL